MEFAVKVEDLGKRYMLRSGVSPEFSRLSQDIYETVGRIFGRHQSQQNQREFWALRHVNLEIKPGEAFGIIGRNGAGKSTLLKILSRVLEPNEGEAEIIGRVNSLLEVGVGFHPELTGRENVFLNGSILGMTKREIKSKFDEIVEFAEIERFIDFPLKSYSSGMQVRLAFAVAATLEAEVMIIDEALTVGDAAFQQKCLRKMREVSAEGRTILLVSHNAGLLASMCPQVLYLAGGEPQAVGPTSEVLAKYLTQTMNPAAEDLERARVSGCGVMARFVEVSNNRTNTYRVGEPLSLRISVQSDLAQTGLSISAIITNFAGDPVATAFPKDTFDVKEGQTVSLEMEIPDPQLLPGRFQWNLSLGHGGWPGDRTDHDIVHGVGIFEVINATIGGEGVRDLPPHIFGSVVAWNAEQRLVDSHRPVVAKILDCQS